MEFKAISSFFTKRSYLSAVFLVLVMIVVLFRFQTDYTQISKTTLDTFVIKQFLLCALELISLLFFLVYAYYFVNYFTFRPSHWFDKILFCLFAVVVVFILPGYIYLNGLLLMGNFFVVTHHEILTVLPDIQFSDFLTLMMENRQPSPPSLPPLNGHIIVGGVHEGKNYVCLDVVQALNKSLSSNPAQLSGKALKTLFRIPDVICAGVEPTKLSKSP